MTELDRVREADRAAARSRPEPDSMRLLYSDHGRVRRGCLTRSEDVVVLTTAGGSEVPPSPGIVLLVPPDMTEPETALLTRATASGYRAERP